MLTNSTVPTPAGSGPARLLAGYGAIVCAAPYLALKIVWLSGGQLGVANAAMMHDPTIVALNVATALMDVVAIAIALAFTHQWGLRLPAWIVLPPMWAASGLLVKFVAGVPIALIGGLLVRDELRAPLQTPVQPWVYAVVYAAFMGMGLGLMIAFALYARTRWSRLFESHNPAVAPGAAHVVEKPLAIAAALLAGAVAAVHLAWALGATFGLSPEVVARRSSLSYGLNALDAVIASVAAVGIVIMVHGRVWRIPFGGAVALTWIGGGYLFAWGVWHLVNVLGNTAFVRDSAGGMALLNLMALLRVLAGLLIGLLMLVVAAEQQDRLRAR